MKLTKSEKRNYIKLRPKKQVIKKIDLAKYLMSYNQLPHIVSKGNQYNMRVFADKIEKIWKKYKKEPKLIAELGCGTGNITGRLAKKGYDMIGIDISEEMLSVAREKAAEEGDDILYLLQDMTEFELYGTVDIILSLCDSMNYITDKEDMLKVFKLANNYLDPHGLFIFDLNTEYKFKNVLSDNTFAETTDDAAYIWENTYDEDEKIKRILCKLFYK